ncbi:hypothetical protein GGI21_003382 [Coemansia aciculifera]|nr:hypothetical protein GGI21_003382 [Coemansia aciculifera]
MQRMCRRILRRRARSASLEQDVQVGFIGDATASLSEVRIVHVGKDTYVGSWSDYQHDYHHDYSDTHSLPFLYYDDADYLAENVVPYLDDCHEERIAAQIMRHQSLIRRNLHRMSLLLVRQPVEPGHAVTLDSLAY